MRQLREESMTMQINGKQGRGTVSLSRLLVCAGLGAALSLVIAVGTASAQTVYNYVYSGTYIDGSSAGVTFNNELGALAYNQGTHELMVADGGSPGHISKYNLAGQPQNFSALGQPFLTIEPSLTAQQLAIDETGGANNGDFYLIGGGSAIQIFKPDGTELSPWTEVTGENLCGVAPAPNGEEVVTASRDGLYRYSLSGKLLKEEIVGPAGFQPGVKIRNGERDRPCGMVFEAKGDIYGIREGSSFYPEERAVKLSPTGLEEYTLSESPNATGVAVDSSDNNVFVLHSSYGNGSFELFDEEGRLLGMGWGEPDPGHGYEGISSRATGIIVDPVTNDVWIANRREYGGVTHVEKFIPTEPHVIPETTATKPGYIDPAKGEHMQLRGTLNADGEATTDCYFEYGTSEELGTTVPCEQGNSFSGSEDHSVTANIGVEKGTRYYYKLIAKNGNEQLAPSNQENFIPQGEPILPGFLGVDRVNTDGARLSSEFDPNGGNASYHFEWGVKGNGFESSSPESKTYGFESEVGLFSGANYYQPGIKSASQEITGLKPGTTYEYRIVVTNEDASVSSSTQEFTTYVPDSGVDTCSNAEVRRQSEGSLLPDCRAYELVSAEDQGGYDVESNLVEGQEPLEAFYPQPEGRLLYSMHFGVLPGIAGSPTNDGRDPYLAVRGNEGWTTKYVGLPSNGMADEGAFGSPLLGADASLETFAFGGADICKPCFPDGSTNIPLRRPDGALEEGMAGSLDPANAEPSGEVRKPLSEDGSHLVFGSKQQFESAGNNGSVTIYDRNLTGGGTQVVSTMPNGSTMTGEVAELDISRDGSRILIGKVVGQDSAGNRLYDLYMHVGDNPDSVKVVETPHGVIYAGMTADGTQVFFTTTDQVPGTGDTDSSADLYRAEVGGSGSASISLVSTGIEGAGNTDACEPVTKWNVPPGGPSNCSVVALAGGAGVARGSGTVFFISPEQLDGSSRGTKNQPNLYMEKLGGKPQFVAEVDSSLVKPPPQPPAHPVISTNFITGLSRPEGMAVDQETGDIYIAELGSGGRIARFDSSGAPDKFTAGPGEGTNRIPNSEMYGSESEIAVDSSGGPLNGAVYAMHGYGSVVIYGQSGVKLGELTGFGEACGVAVNQNTGEVFVGDWTYGGIHRFKPTSGSTPVSNANYEETSIHTEGQNPCHVGADTAGHAFAVSYSTGPLERYNVSDFSAAAPTKGGAQVANTSYALSTDPVNGDLYNDEGNKIVVYNSSGTETGTIGSSESLGSTSKGVAVNGNTKFVYALDGNKVTEFGYEVIPYHPIDNPAVVHGVEQAGVHDFEDFQVTPDGHYAVFASPVSLTGYQNLEHYEIYRYDTETEETACVSCAPTNAVGSADVKLSSSGLNLAVDGRVFFTSGQSLTLRDTDERTDAYEWNDGRVALISSGIGQYNSALLSASANGKDAFFFTRDSLVPTDHNGAVVKIYDAREVGGSFYNAPRLPCASSDECHGAGSQPPPPPPISTDTPAQGAFPPVTSEACAKGKVKKHGKCVVKGHHHRSHHKRRHKHRKNRKHGSSHRHG